MFQIIVVTWTTRVSYWYICSDPDIWESSWWSTVSSWEGDFWASSHHFHRICDAAVSWPLHRHLAAWISQRGTSTVRVPCRQVDNHAPCARRARASVCGEREGDQKSKDRQEERQRARGREIIAAAWSVVYYVCPVTGSKFQADMYAKITAISNSLSPKPGSASMALATGESKERFLPSTAEILTSLWHEWSLNPINPKPKPLNPNPMGPQALSPWTLKNWTQPHIQKACTVEAVLWH